MNNEHVVEEIEHRGLTVKIYYDLEPESPREWDNLGLMVAFHSKYNLGDKDHGYTAEELRHLIGHRLKGDPIIALPLYLYDHGGVSMSTGSFVGRAHHAEWDSGQVGYIFVTKEKVREEYSVKRISPKLYDKVLEVLKGEVSTYDDYLRGDVYGYVVEDQAGERLDSCWGFYGFEYCMQEAKSMADWHAEEQAKEAAQIHHAEIHETRAHC
jgi:hypothetical protein